jgi:NAD+ synthase (glutamine-hydrolysing)
MDDKQKIKFALYQFNSIVGDFEYNTKTIIQQIIKAKDNNCDVFVLPELALCGYPVEDILFRSNFEEELNKSLKKFLSIHGITLFITAPRFEQDNIYNSIYIIRDGVVIDYYDKRSLPNYGVFDDKRYFNSGNRITTININNYKITPLICEDIWDENTVITVLEDKPNIVCVINASPFEIGKQQKRINLIKKYSIKYNIPIIYLNMVGGQDDIIYDGNSFVTDNQGNIIIQFGSYQEQLKYYNYQEYYSIIENNEVNQTVSIYRALVLSIQDYVKKNRFKGCIIGLSGGIDSALTLAIIQDAIGIDNVRAFMMPSIYTNQISLDDSKQMIELLNMEQNYHIIDIWGIYNQFIEQLSPIFDGLNIDTTEENLQARIRGTLLMAVSNKFGYLVVTTGNKSEMATGYATLYGDMAGGFALLKDVYKTTVYELAKWRNQQSYIIPKNIINRPPSAELKDNQLDSDSLPDYETLDSILKLLIEKRLSTDAIVKSTEFDRVVVTKIAKLLKTNEYKRRQSAIGPKISSIGFTKDWRYPITHNFNY